MFTIVLFQNHVDPDKIRNEQVCLEIPDRKQYPDLTISDVHVTHLPDSGLHAEPESRQDTRASQKPFSLPSKESTKTHVTLHEISEIDVILYIRFTFHSKRFF